MFHPEQTTANRKRPNWVEDFVTFYRGRIARQFVLHFNINDFVIDLSERRELTKGEVIRTGEIIEVTDQLLIMREYLYQFLFQELGCQAIYTYSLSKGLLARSTVRNVNSTSFDHNISEHGQALQRLQEAWQILKSSSQRREGRRLETEGQSLPDTMLENFKLLDHMLHQPYFDKENIDISDRESPIAVILDSSEKLIPYHLGEGHGEREQLQILDFLEHWGHDPLIRRTNNIIILLTTNIGQIASTLYKEGSGCRAIRVPLPDEYEREAFIRYEMKRARTKLARLDSKFGSTVDEQARSLARNTQGMRLIDIDNVNRRVIVENWRREPKASNFNPIMSSVDVQRLKAEVIQTQSEQLLEIVYPIRSFNEIGGLTNLKRYLRSCTTLMRKGSASPLIPSGLLLAGPPGTGKTIIAEALATESGFNLVKMRNIQDKWVGSSERNLDLVLNLLKDLHPVIVFIDEIDQAMTRRDTGLNGDSGVSARMFARILEEIGNPSNRGRILWVAATNRADLLDQALLRRFDRVIPLLLPNVEESCRIFASMLNNITIQRNYNVKIVYGGNLSQSGNIGNNGYSDPTTEDIDKFLSVAEKTSELGLTGAGIEAIVCRAIEIAYEGLMSPHSEASERDILVDSCHLLAALDDYKPNYNRFAYDYQSLLAIRSSNFYSVIPGLPKNGIFGRIQREDGRIDPEKFETVLAEVESRLHVGLYM